MRRSRSPAAWRLYAQLIAIVLIVVFGLGTTHARGGSASTCRMSCPADCPMHKNKLGCHHGAQAPDVHRAHDCHRQDAHGLQSAGCQHRPDGMTPSDQPALLPLRIKGRAPDPLRGQPASTVRLPVGPSLDPPFHPPRARARSL